MVEDSNPAQDMIDITGHELHENVSYDKDVLEIKLPDDVVSSDHGDNFVKDVCIDKVVVPHRNIQEEKIVDEKSSPNFNYIMIDANGDLRYRGKDYATKTAHELNSETALLPVGFSPDSNDEKQYSSGKELDLDGRDTATCGDISEKKISLEELLRLESEEESQNACTISSERSENHMPPVGQVSKNVCHEVEALASKTDDIFRSGVSSDDIASASSATSEIRDTTASSDEPVCSVGMTDSPSDLASGSKGLVGTESMSAALTSTSSDVQSSEYNKDHSESNAREAIIDALEENETTVATSSPHIVESSDENWEIHKNSETDNNGGTTDVHDLNQIDEESSLFAAMDDAQGCSTTDMGELQGVLPESAKGKSRNANVYPFEPSSFGPSSIMSAAVVTTSGHIAYSGNTSLRSDSSTTSTRSFAFPVLQRDWISSPVRMAKAERRRTRRRRGSWRKGLLCCKF